MAKVALKRDRGGGRRALAEPVAEELWRWFVDRVRHESSRVTTELLAAQARVLVADAKECWHKQCERGEANPEAPPILTSTTSAGGVVPTESPIAP